MQQSADLFERRTTADVVFEHLHREITSLELLPGTKLSEAEIARRFGVSRQPVREAFGRLGNLELLLVRPQKATVVRGFSLQRVAHVRFVRLAVELEVVRQACTVWDDRCDTALQENIEQQQLSLTHAQHDQFHALDEEFHKLICTLGGCPLALDVISECRQKIERLCSLSLARQSEADTLLDDHHQLAAALRNHSAQQAEPVVRLHLSRLDKTIEEIHLQHPDYFE